MSKNERKTECAGLVRVEEWVLLVGASTLMMMMKKMKNSYSVFRLGRLGEWELSHFAILR